ncbi:MAG: SIMPL domain-containing protein [Chloroflexota bacterium]
MNRVKFGGTFALLTAVMLAVFALPAAAQEGSSDSYPVNTITVVGSGSASGAPDIATIEIGVETMNPDIAVAFEDTNTTIDQIITTLVDAGIAREDIRTVSLNVYQDRSGVPGPMESGPAGQQQSVNYVVSNQIRVVVRDINNVADVVNTAVSAGATNIYGLNFGIDDTDALESEARSAAIEDARARASELAELAGVTLGDIVIINEAGGGNFGPMDARSLPMAEAGFGGGAAIEPGQLSVAVQLQVTFRINN